MNVFFKNKQLISVFLLLIMFIGLIPTEVIASQGEKRMNMRSAASSDHDYGYEDEERTILNSYEGEEEIVEIPSNVKIIKKYTFQDKNIKTLILNEGLEIIEEGAFTNNEISNYIQFPKSLRHIEPYAFADNNISNLDFSKIQELAIRDGAFQDNNLTGQLNLTGVSYIGENAFMSNKISGLTFSHNMREIKKEAFVDNKLTSVYIGSYVTIGKDAFAGNGQYVILNGPGQESSKSEDHQYGHISNPVNIIVRFLEPIMENGQNTGKYKKIKKDKEIKFNPYNSDNFFTLNKESTYKAENIYGYELDIDKHASNEVSFVPNKDNFVVDIFYKKSKGPHFEVNTGKLNNLLSNKQAGSDISNSELLSLVKVVNSNGKDISSLMEVSPTSILNAESKEYEVTYVVNENNTNITSYKLKLPISINPFEIPIANTNWVLGDFIYEQNTVTGLSKSGAAKAMITPGIAIPHMNPETMEPIEIVDFIDKNNSSKLENIIKEGEIIFGDSESIKQIKACSFKDIPITGTINLPNVVYIEKEAFSKSKVNISLDSLMFLEEIGKSSFEGTNVSGNLGEMPKLKHLGERAFYNTGVSGFHRIYPELISIGDKAFQESSISGKLPAAPKLKVIGASAFYGTSISEFPANYPELERIHNNAFATCENLTGSLPKMDKLTNIYGNAFFRSTINSFYAIYPNLTEISSGAFQGTTKITNVLPEMPKLTSIGNKAFSSSFIKGPMPEMPNLKEIGIEAFDSTQLTRLPSSFPNLTILRNGAFESCSQLACQLPEMPNLEKIEDNVFRRTLIYGDLPNMSNLKEIGKYNFNIPNIKNNTVIPINSDILISPEIFYENYTGRTFRNSNLEHPYDNVTSMSFKTIDGKMVSNIEDLYEEGRVLINPKPIKITVLNTKGEIIFSKENFYVSSESFSDFTKYYIPKIKIPNYVSEPKIFNDIGNKEEIEITYKTPLELFDKTNEKDHSISLDYKENLNRDNMVFNIKVGSKGLKSNDRIKVSIDQNVVAISAYGDFIKSSSDKINVSSIRTPYGFDIVFNNDVSGGAEFSLTGTRNKNDIYLRPAEKNVNTKIFTEIIESQVSDTNVVNVFEHNIEFLHQDPGRADYSILVNNVPRGPNINIYKDSNSENYYGDLVVLIKDGVISPASKSVLKIDPIKYLDKDGNEQVAKIITDGWEYDDGYYIYTNNNLINDKVIPSPVFRFHNPVTQKTLITGKGEDDFILKTLIPEDRSLRSRLDINVFETSDINLDLSVISHKYSKKTNELFFYDNVEDKSKNFDWSTKFLTRNEINQLSLRYKDLDKRMFYNEIDPKGEPVEINLIDREGKVFYKKDTINKIKLNTKHVENIAEIHLNYKNIETNKSINPIISTKLKNPTEIGFSENNLDNNIFNHTVSVVSEDDNDDFELNTASSNIRIKNDSMNGVMRLTISDYVTLQYGETSKEKVLLELSESHNKKVDTLKASLFVDKSISINKIIPANDLSYDKFDYSISESKSNPDLTRVDIEFTNALIDTDNSYAYFRNTYVPMFDVELTSNVKERKRTSSYFFLDLGEDFTTNLEDFGIQSSEQIWLDEFNSTNSCSSKCNIVSSIASQDYFLVKNSIGKDSTLSSSLSTFNNEKFFYQIDVDNSRQNNRYDFELINVLPHKGDSFNSQYENILDLDELKNTKLPDGFTMEFLNQNESIQESAYEDFYTLSKKSWSSSPAKNTKALKIKASTLSGGKSNKVNTIFIPMITKPNLTYLEAGEVIRNNFAYVVDNQAPSKSNDIEQQAFIYYENKNIKLINRETEKNQKGSPITSSVFSLINSKGQVVETQETNSEGLLIFEGIGIDDYKIKQTKVSKDFKINNKYIYISKNDLKKANETLDLGVFENERNDEYFILFKNVEIYQSPNTINYNDLNNNFSKNIKGSNFILKNEETKTEMPFSINERNGALLKVKAGLYTLTQENTPIDNNTNYKDNKNEYKFRLDKYGFIYINDGPGSSLDNPIKQEENMVLFPNQGNHALSNLTIKNKSKNGELLNGAQFEVKNIHENSSEILSISENGIGSIQNLLPGIYEVKQISSSKHHLKDNKVQTISISPETAGNFEIEFINNKIVFNINKSKLVTSNIESEFVANKIAENIKPSKSGNIVVIQESNKTYSVKEVFSNHIIDIDGHTFHTDKNGQINDLQDRLSLNSDSVLVIKNKTKTPGHTEDNEIKIDVSDYADIEDFDGVIDVDINVRPLRGSIYVSKYVIDKNNSASTKGGSVANGATYVLYGENPSTGTPEYIGSKKITNDNYALFNDLDPNRVYIIYEQDVPEGQEKANPGQYTVTLTDNDLNTASVVFRNYIELKEGRVKLQHRDAMTNKPLQGAVFEIKDKYNNVERYTTDSNGYIIFDNLRYDLADYTIREIKAAPGHKASSQVITVTESDILKETLFSTTSYQYNKTPDTGTNGKLPFFLMSIPLIVLAYVFNKKRI